MTSKYKSEAGEYLFLTYKKAPDTDDLYDPSLIGVTYNEKNSEISLYALKSKTGMPTWLTVLCETKRNEMVLCETATIAPNTRWRPNPEN